MATAQTQRETVDLLRAQCERCVECLNELTVIHLGLGAPSRKIESANEACYYRLRKVLLHVRAITGWEIEIEVLHIIAPEVRCANKQLEKVLASMPASFRVNYFGDEDSPFAGKFRKVGKELREIVSSFVHPTPQRLLLPTERGGFFKTNKEPSLIYIVWMLVDLASKYAVSVDYLTTDSKTESARKLAAIFLQLSSVVTTVGELSLDEIFNAVE